MNALLNGGRRRALLLTCALVVVGAIAAAFLSPFVLRVGTLRVLSSRRPQDSAVPAALAALGIWLLSLPAERRRARSIIRAGVTGMRGIVALAVRLVVQAARQVPASTAPVLAAGTALAVVVVALLTDAPVAGGADAYGYVSQADLWVKGDLRIEQPFVRDMQWPFAERSFTPLGYVPAASGTAIVPQYSPGLPMVMAVFELVAGRDAVFYVVPLLGGVAVWMTYLMGTWLAGRGVGLSAAILLASSPVFLIQLMAPLSDVPVTAWWAAALALLLSKQRLAAFGAGLAAGAAILTRPNLVPLAAVPGVLLLLAATRERALAGRASQRLLLFVAGVVPACIAVAMINTWLYGSPLASGYPPFSELFGWQNLMPNLARYPSWMLETQTPLVLIALVAPVLVARMRRETDTARRSDLVAVAWAWLAFVAAVFVCYIFYVPFDGWFWLRFVLPAFPPLFVLLSLGLTAPLARLERGARVAVTTTVVGALAWHGAAFARERGVFSTRTGEQRYVAIGKYITTRLPERAVFVSMQHSGSIRYYSGRLTVRYDAIAPYRLDSVLDELRRHGYHPYIVLEDWEEPSFQARFKDDSALAALDWTPVAAIEDVAHVKIYDPAERGATDRRAPDLVR